MKMCPQNQMVYGFQTKMSERDGLAALNILCKNPFNSKEKSIVLVRDGEGSWGAIK
jgi:hypothetical protein